MTTTPITHPAEEHGKTRRTYTVPEVAEILGISRNSAYQAVRRGEIPAVAIGRRLLVSAHWLDRFLA